MTETVSLSGEEVDALMQGLSREAEAAEAPSEAPRPYSLGSRASRPTAALPALDRMSERLARRLRPAIEPFSRMKPRVTAHPVAVQHYDEWRSEQPEFTSISLYRFRPLKGGVLIAVEPELISRFVDAFYGGSGAASTTRGKEFTATEERLLGRLTEALVAVLAEIWAEIIPVQPQLMSRETNTAFAGLVRGDEAVAICRFMVGAGHGRDLPIDILYPVASIRVVEAELSAKVHDDGGMSARDWKERMAEALLDVRIEARSVLARPQLSVAEVLQLAPGDVIPISVPALVPLLVAGRQIALGKIGDNDGSAALQIERIETRSSK